MTTEVFVRRYKCDHCGRTRAAKSAAVKHEAGCHKNPASRACSSCRHFTSHPCCDYPSDDCGCKGLNACAVGAFLGWQYNDHATKEPDPDGWWTHVVDWRRDCPSWEDVQ